MKVWDKIIFYTSKIVVRPSIPVGQANMSFPTLKATLAFSIIHGEYLKKI